MLRASTDPKDILKLKDDNALIAAFSSALDQKLFNASTFNRINYGVTKYNDLTDFVIVLIQSRMFSRSESNFLLMEKVFALADSNPQLKKVIQYILQDTQFFYPSPLINLLVPNKKLFEKGLAYLKEIPEINIEKILSNAYGHRPNALSTLATSNEIDRIESLLSEYKFTSAQSSKLLFHFNNSSMEMKTIQFLSKKGIKVSRKFGITPNATDPSFFYGWGTDAFAYGNSSIQKLIWLHEDDKEIYQDEYNYQQRKGYLALLSKQSKLCERKEIIKTKKKLIGGFFYINNQQTYVGGNREELSARELEVKRSDIAYLQGLLIEAQSKCSDNKAGSGYTLQKAEQYYLEAASANNLKAILKMANLYFNQSSMDDALRFFELFVESFNSDSDINPTLLGETAKMVIDYIHKCKDSKPGTSKRLLGLLLTLSQYHTKIFYEKLDIYSCDKLAELFLGHGQPLEAARCYLKQHYLLKETPSSSITSDGVKDNIHDCFVTDILTNKDLSFENLFSDHSQDMELFLITLSKYLNDSTKSSSLSIKDAVKHFTLKVIYHGLENINNPEFEKNIQRFLNFINQHKDELPGIIDDAVIKKIEDKLKWAFNKKFENYSQDPELKSATDFLASTVESAKEDKFSYQSLIRIDDKMQTLAVGPHRTKIQDMMESLKGLLKTMLLFFVKRSTIPLEEKRIVKSPPSPLLQHSLLSSTSTPEPIGIEDDDLSLDTSQDLSSSPSPAKVDEVRKIQTTRFNRQ